LGFRLLFSIAAHGALHGVQHGLGAGVAGEGAKPGGSPFNTDLRRVVGIEAQAEFQAAIDTQRKGGRCTIGANSPDLNVQ
jgi:hypothetical protein